MSEYVRVRKEEWDGFLKQNELLIQRFEGLVGKVKELTQANNTLREKMQVTEERLRTYDQKLGADFKDTSRVLQKQLSEMTRVLQLTEAT
jgi:hypothetical protein